LSRFGVRSLNGLTLLRFGPAPQCPRLARDAILRISETNPDRLSDVPPVLYSYVGRRQQKRESSEKTVDETIYLKKPRKGAKLKEEVWQTRDGKVVKYSLAYINPSLLRIGQWPNAWVRR